MTPKRWPGDTGGVDPSPELPAEQLAVQDLGQPLAQGATYTVLGLEVIYLGQDWNGQGITGGPLHRFEAAEGRLELVGEAFLNELRLSGLVRVVEGR